MDQLKFNILIHKFKVDKAAFDEIYLYYFPKIKIFIGRRYQDYHLGEDIAQEFFMKLFSISIPTIITSPTVWITTICENMARMRVCTSEDMTIPYDDEMAAAAQDESYPLANGGISKENMEVLENLDEITIQILVMHFWEGYRYNEISQKLGISYALVRQKVVRCVKKLRKFL